MNKDLEIIKELCDVEVPYDEVCSIYANALSEIQAAAVRMAEEIEQQKECKENNYDRLIEAQDEISRLKAALASKPDVVRCGECRRRNMLFQCPISEANALIKQLEKVPSKKPFIELTDDCFCSNGERRESEEGK